MAKAINRLAVQQSLVQNGMAEHEAAGNVANVLGDEIDAAMADLVTKRDLDEAVAQINKRMDDNDAALRLEIAELRGDFETLRGDFETLRADFAGLRAYVESRDRERAERESEWWRQQQERDDARQKEQQARDDAWRRELQARDDAWRKEQQARDDARQQRDDEWRKEMQARDDARQQRDDEWRKEMQARDDKWREEMQKRDDRAHAREVAAAEAASKMTSRILWAIFGSAAALGAAAGIALALTGG